MVERLCEHDLDANNAQAQARAHTELAARYYQAGQVA